MVVKVSETAHRQDQLRSEVPPHLRRLTLLKLVQDNLELVVNGNRERVSLALAVKHFDLDSELGHDVRPPYVSVGSVPLEPNLDYLLEMALVLLYQLVNTVFHFFA